MKGVVKLIDDSLNKDIKIVRVHVGGDFFGPEYFEAWMKAAELNPDMKFYAYTKSVKLYMKHINKIPNNFLINASMGGVDDKLIKEHNLPHSRIFVSYGRAIELGYPIDFDDSIAHMEPEDRLEKYGTYDFALLVHGTQGKGSLASKETRHNTAFLNGMKAHKKGYGGSLQQMIKFNASQKYSKSGRMNKMYEDWKEGWDQYATQNSTKPVKENKASPIDTSKPLLKKKKKASLEKKWSDAPKV